MRLFGLGGVGELVEEGAHRVRRSVIPRVPEGRVSRSGPGHGGGWRLGVGRRGGAQGEGVVPRFPQGDGSGLGAGQRGGRGVRPLLGEAVEPGPVEGLGRRGILPAGEGADLEHGCVERVGVAHLLDQGVAAGQRVLHLAGLQQPLDALLGACLGGIGQQQSPPEEQNDERREGGRAGAAGPATSEVRRGVARKEQQRREPHPLALVGRQGGHHDHEQQEEQRDQPAIDARPRCWPEQERQDRRRPQHEHGPHPPGQGVGRGLRHGVGHRCGGGIPLGDLPHDVPDPLHRREGVAQAGARGRRSEGPGLRRGHPEERDLGPMLGGVCVEAARGALGQGARREVPQVRAQDPRAPPVLGHLALVGHGKQQPQAEARCRRPPARSPPPQGQGEEEGRGRGPGGADQRRGHPPADGLAAAVGEGALHAAVDRDGADEVRHQGQRHAQAGTADQQG